MATKENMDDDADYYYEDDDEDDEDKEPDYYICLCCGYSTIKYQGGWGCPKCTAHMEEGYF